MSRRRLAKLPLRRASLDEAVEYAMHRRRERLRPIRIISRPEFEPGQYEVGVGQVRLAIDDYDTFTDALRAAGWWEVEG